VTGITARLIARLEQFGKLSVPDQQAIEESIAIVRRFIPRDDLVKEGDLVDRAYVITQGFACRYKLLPDGRRQILGLLLPGDLCDPRGLLLARRDHSISALSSVEVLVMASEFSERVARSVALSRALSCYALVHEAILREWLVNVGHRTSFERIGHLFCEIYTRLRAVGLVANNACEVPLTQLDIADSLALSAVHVNRTLMELRRSGLLMFQNKELLIEDFYALAVAAGFDDTYLHLERGIATNPEAVAS
jgi:CRP-like cAMP-binding protein